MRRTSIPLLIAAAAVAGALAWLGQTALTASGHATLTPPVTLVLVLFAIGGIVPVFGWPVRQWVRGRRDKPLDPFRAMRVLMLAKASSFTGALFAGAAGGLLLYALTRDVLPNPGTIVLIVGVLVGSVAAATAGLVVESWCRLPPDDPADTVPAAPAPEVRA